MTDDRRQMEETEDTYVCDTTAECEGKIRRLKRWLNGAILFEVFFVAALLAQELGSGRGLLVKLFRWLGISRSFMDVVAFPLILLLAVCTGTLLSLWLRIRMHKIHQPELSS